MSWGIYVHVPWCRVRCPYCAFYVEVTPKAAPFRSFTERVLKEFEQRRPQFDGPIRSLYLGGGTPSQLPDEEIAALVSHLSGPHTQEITIEMNPEDVTAQRLEALALAGVTRVSLGVQSLSPQTTRPLGRAHTLDQAHQALHDLQHGPFASWTADLMFGLHQQTVEQALSDLEELLTYAPPHISLYGLTVEEGTAYERAARAGKIVPADEDTWRQMYGGIVERLSVAGLHRYEVSNFARPGHEAVHNSGYWEHLPYCGLGPSAHGLLPDGTRYANHRNLKLWLDADDPTAQLDPPDPEGMAIDLLISGLRAVKGLPLDTLHRLTHHTVDPRVLTQLRRQGVLSPAPERLALHGEGWFVADAVVRKLVEGLRSMQEDSAET